MSSAEVGPAPLSCNKRLLTSNRKISFDDDGTPTLSSGELYEPPYFEGPDRDWKNETWWDV